MPRHGIALLALVVAACSSAPQQPEQHGVVPGSIGAIVEGSPGGVRVRELAPDGPAARAGLREGDLIIRCADEPVITARAFNSCVLTTPPGRRVRLDVVRDSETRAVEVNVIQLGTASRV
jgi:S1-C subfamily serine protease